MIQVLRKTCQLAMWFAFLLAIWVFLAPQAEATEPKSLIINEVYFSIDPTKGVDPDDEWVELYNAAEYEVNLKDWKVEDNTSKKILTNTDLLVPPKGFALISKTKATWSYWNIDPLLNNVVFVELGANIGNGLSNSGDVIKLTNSNGSLEDEFSWGNNKSVFDLTGIPTGQSWGRKIAGIDNNLADDWTRQIKPTPGSVYIPPTYPHHLLITEALPFPADGTQREYIELYNDGNENIDLTGWQIDDADGGSQPFTITTGTISAKEFLIFYRYTTNVALNDNGDQARLIDPGGKVVSMLSYEKARRAESYSLVDNTWQWTIASTPGHENLLIRNIGAFGALDSTVVSTIQAGKQMGDGAIITIAGEVSAPPRSLSARYFYVQDDSAAIQVYCHSCILPELIPGTVIQATGKLSGDTSERRLIIAGTENIYVLNYTEAPKPKKVDIVAIGEITESQYVIIRGKVTNTSGDTFYVSDGTSQARILVRNRSVVNKPTLRKGYEVEVAGIVSQYRGEFRILPFSRGHVKIIHRTGQKQQNRLPNSGSSGLISLALTTLIWNILQLAKRQLTKLPKRC